MRWLIVAWGLAWPAGAQEVQVRFYTDPVDAEVYMVDTADHYLGPADHLVSVNLQNRPQGVHFRFERRGFAPRTTLDRVTQGRLQKQDGGFRYPPDSLGPVELEPLQDWRSRVLQAGLFFKSWALWLLLPTGGLALLWRQGSRRQPGRPADIRGVRLGEYELLEQIGKGGMSEVYRGRRAEDTVAVKLLNLELSQSQEAVERFRREVRAHLALSHPNLPMLIDWGEHRDGRLYLVMELLQGETLKERMVRSGQLAESEVVAILTALAAALDYLHSQGFVHRDVKPSNVFCLSSGGVKLTDMGIAQNLALAPLTSTGTAVGTPHYMAPEQISGRAEPASDQYALGVMAFEMLAGRRPFHAADAQGLLQLQLRQMPPSISEFYTAASPELEDAIARMLAKNPQARFADCKAAAAALALGLGGGASEDTVV